MKKFYSKILIVVVLITLISSTVIASSNEKSKGEISKEILEKTVSFMLSSMSDFSEKEEYQDYLISEDSIEFKEFLNNKREIAEIKQDYSGKWIEKSSEVIDVNYKEISKDMYEVTADIGHNFYSGEDESYVDIKYKVIIYNTNNDIKVLSGMCNGLSAGTLYPENIIKSAGDLKVIDWEYDSKEKNQLFNSDNYVEVLDYANYDYKETKENLLNWYQEEMYSTEQGNEEVDELDISIFRAPNWNFFSSSEKSEMTQYQKNHYNNYNRSYADFTGVGGDCTNYASQILRAGGSAFNSSSSSGIMGDSYWYYRDSSNRSTSWTASRNLKNFLLRSVNTLGPKATTVSKYGDLDVGSIVFLTRSGTPYHSIIVAESGGDPMVSAHTSDYYGRYSNRYSGITHIKAHVRGYYE